MTFWQFAHENPVLTFFLGSLVVLAVESATSNIAKGLSRRKRVSKE